jgi:hypothetical protein
MKTPGNTTLELGLARAWEKQAPAKRFTVNVRVLQ